MASAKKVVANRANSRRSTGPRSTKGKAVSARNAVRHGLLSKLPVLPGVERQEDWDEHLQRTIEAINPVGYMEELLAERLALIWWRLRRLAHYEQAVGETMICGAKGSLSAYSSAPISLYDAEVRADELLQTTREDAAFIESAQSVDRDAYIDPEVAARIVQRVAVVGEVVADCDELRELFGENRHLARPLGEMPWTCGILVDALAGIEDASGIETDHALQELIKWADAEQARVAAEIDRRRRSRTVMGSQRLEPLARYEAGLERSLYRALHELGRLQAHRPGGHVHPPVAVDVTVEAGSSGV